MLTSIEISLPARLRSLRKSRKWTQTDLGQRVGAATQTIYKLEMGHRTITLEWAEQFANAFGMSLPDFMFGKPAESLTHYLPVIPLEDVARWNDASTKPLFHLYWPECGSGTIVLKNIDTSPSSAGPGIDLIFIDPSLQQLRHDHVYLTQDKTQRVSIRRYHADPAKLNHIRDADGADAIIVGQEEFKIFARVLNILYSY